MAVGFGCPVSINEFFAFLSRAHEEFQRRNYVEILTAAGVKGGKGIGTKHRHQNETTSSSPSMRRVGMYLQNGERSQRPVKAHHACIWESLAPLSLSVDMIDSVLPISITVVAHV